MFKKIIKVFSFFALIQVLAYSCCDESFNVYYDSVEFIATDRNDTLNTTIASQDLVLNVSFLYNYIQISEIIKWDEFSNSVYATSCNEDYFFKDSITSINIISNEAVLNIDAGSSLNDKLIFINPKNLENQSINDLVNFLNNENSVYGYERLDIRFNEMLTSNLVLDFSIQIELQGDRVLESTTNLITIE